MMNIIVVIFTIIMYTSMLFGAYDVKIGVYKNAKNLHAKILQIKNTTYRKYVVVDKRGKFHYAHAVLSTNKKAHQALRIYKRVFPDAFISKEQITLKKRRIKKTQKKVLNANNKKQIKKILKTTKHIDATTLLNNKTFYLCYDKAPKAFKSRVVKMVFSKDSIEYMPLDNKDSHLNIDYVFREDTIILNLLDMNVTHKIDAVKKGYLVASNQDNNVTIYTLRYYFDKENALNFIKTKKNIANE